MATPLLPPPPLNTPPLQSDGTLSSAWARWFQQLQAVVKALGG